MKKLSQTAYEKAKNYIQKHARPIDQALFEYYFEGGSPIAVHDALAAYQNPDGGFGRGLEPDIRSEASSPYVTTIALQYLIAIETGSASELVQGAIAYLLNTYDFDLNGWMTVFEAVNDAPHAPWWDYEEETSRKNATEHWGNPTAEIVGYLNHYADLVIPDFLFERTRRAENWIEQHPNEMEMHELMCVVRLSNLLPAPDVVIERLSTILPQSVAMKPADWEGYGLRPSAVVDSPESPLAEILGSSLPESVEFEIGQQGDDGAWHPPWNWGRDEDVWKVAEREWSGHITVKMLKMFHNFGCIEGLPDKV